MIKTNRWSDLSDIESIRKKIESSRSIQKIEFLDKKNRFSVRTIQIVCYHRVYTMLSRDVSGKIFVRILGSIDAKFNCAECDEGRVRGFRIDAKTEIFRSLFRRRPWTIWRPTRDVRDSMPRDIVADITRSQSCFFVDRLTIKRPFYGSMSFVVRPVWFVFYLPLYCRRRRIFRCYWSHHTLPPLTVRRGFLFFHQIHHSLSRSLHIPRSTTWPKRPTVFSIWRSPR